MQHNLNGLFVNLSRAYEIALLGGLSIQVVFQKDYTNGFDDYERIKNFYQGVEFSKSGELVIEITQPEYIKHGDRFETLADIQLRVENAKTNQLPTVFAHSSCDSLLKTATERLNFSLHDVEKVKQISGVIAQLDGSENIRVEHVAEAIQYRGYRYYEPHCNAEDKALTFGKGISISLHDLEADNIQAAIDYLTTLK
jgi:hypothetical protein